MMIAEHPTSEVRKVVLGRFHGLWSFLFGFLYYAAKGLWGPAVLSLLTVNGLFVIFPLKNRTIVRGWYEKHGWRVHDS